MINIFNDDLSKSTVYYEADDIPIITQSLIRYVNVTGNLLEKRVQDIRDTKLYTTFLGSNINGEYECLVVNAPLNVNIYLSPELDRLKNKA